MAPPSSLTAIKEIHREYAGSRSVPKSIFWGELINSSFGSGHFGRTRMEEAATGKSGCSWSERALRATGNGATAAPRPQSPHAPPPGLLSLGLALRAGCCVTSGHVGAPKRVSGYWRFGLSQSRGCCLLFSLPHTRKFKY